VTSAPAVHVVDMIYAEVISAFRQIALRGELTTSRAELALDLLVQLRLRRHSARALSPRIWALRGIRCAR
jgi:predicted nucleic acid-binding protein